MSYQSDSYNRVITSYLNQTQPYKPRDHYQLRLIALAAALRYAKYGENSFADVEPPTLDCYNYVYLDTRKPRGIYTYTCPSGKVVTFNYPPYYVGKGKGQRSTAHLRSALTAELDAYTSHLPKMRTTRAILRTGKKPIIRVIPSRLSEMAAYAFEIDLIAGIGRRNLGKGPLTNLTDGGEGLLGYEFTDRDRRKMSKSQRKRFDAETAEQKRTRVNKAKATNAARPEVNEERVRKITAFNSRDDVRQHKAEVTRRQWSKPGFKEQKVRKQRETWQNKSQEDRDLHARRTGEASKAMWADPVFKQKHRERMRSSFTPDRKQRQAATITETLRRKSKPFVWHFSSTKKVRVHMSASQFAREYGLNQVSVSAVLSGAKKTYKNMWGNYV